MAAKELNITEFDFVVEKDKIEAERGSLEPIMPLSSPPGVPNRSQEPVEAPAAAISGTDKQDIKDEGTE